MTWTLDTLNLDLAAAGQVAETVAGEAPATAALMHAMIAFNAAVENSPITQETGAIYEEVGQLDLPEVAAFIALIIDTAQQADEILDSAALGEYWLASHRGLLEDAKAGIERYGEALAQIVNLFSADEG
jgi:hypothetical protein